MPPYSPDPASRSSHPDVSGDNPERGLYAHSVRRYCPSGTDIRWPRHNVPSNVQDLEFWRVQQRYLRTVGRTHNPQEDSYLLSRATFMQRSHSRPAATPEWPWKWCHEITPTLFCPAQKRLNAAVVYRGLPPVRGRLAKPVHTSLPLLSKEWAPGRGQKSQFPYTPVCTNTTNGPSLRLGTRPYLDSPETVGSAQGHEVPSRACRTFSPSLWRAGKTASRRKRVVFIFNLSTEDYDVSQLQPPLVVAVKDVFQTFQELTLLVPKLS